MNLVKGNTLNKFEQNEEQVLLNCKKFIQNASSVYLDYVKKSSFMPYINETKAQIKKCDNCFDFLLKDLHDTTLTNNNKKDLQLYSQNLQNKIQIIKQTIAYTQKSTKVYYDYIKNTGVTSYAKQIKKDFENTLNVLQIYLELYNNEYDYTMDQVYSL